MVGDNDGTVSFKSFNGNYLSAQNGGGDGMALYVNRTVVGSWEKVYLVNLSDGKIALKTHDKENLSAYNSDVVAHSSVCV